MLKKIIDWFNEPLVFKKQEMKKTEKKLNYLYDTLQEQAESINFILQQLEIKKETTTRQERKIRELKKENEYLMKRDNILQNVEMLFDNDKPTIAKIRKIINGK